MIFGLLTGGQVSSLEILPNLRFRHSRRHLDDFVCGLSVESIVRSFGFRISLGVGAFHRIAAMWGWGGRIYCVSERNVSSGSSDWAGGSWGEGVNSSWKLFRCWRSHLGLSSDQLSNLVSSARPLVLVLAIS